MKYYLYLAVLMLVDFRTTIFAEESTRYGILPSKGEDLYDEIKEGTIELSDIPILIIRWIDWLTYLAGSIAVIMVIVGGYQYLLGSVTDDKERGKKTLMYALVGVAVTFSSWILVNWVQTWLTS